MFQEEGVKLIGVNYMNIIDPHKKISRLVTGEDLVRVKNEAVAMIDFCKNPTGNLKQILSLAHPQIEKKDPLRFFVTENGEIIINPKITNHTKTTIDSFEGSVSFPNEPMITVQRWNVCELVYSTLEEGRLITCNEHVKGRRAEMFQHEIDHLDAKYIYITN